MGGKLRDWSFLTMALDLPWLEIILLQGPLPRDKGWAWYELDDSLRRTDRTESDIARSRALVMDSLASLHRPGGRVVLGGFSQGCVVALETGLREDIPLAGVLGISGYVPLLDAYPSAFGTRATNRRILTTHGQWDQVIPVSKARDQFAALAARGAPVRLEIFDKGHTLDLEDEIPRIRQWLEGCLAP